MIVPVLLAAVVAVPASADEYDDQRAQAEARQRAVDGAMVDVQELLEDTDAALVAAYTQLRDLEARLPVAQAAVEAAEAELTRLQTEAAIAQQRLDAAEDTERMVQTEQAEGEARAAEVRVALARTARLAYRGELGSPTWSVLLRAESSDQLVAEATLVATAGRVQTGALRQSREVAAVARNRATRLAAVRERVAALDAEVDALVAAAADQAADARSRRDELDRLVADQVARTAAIEAQRSAQLAKKAEYEAQQAALADEIAAVLREQAAARAAANPAPATTPPATSGALLTAPVQAVPPVITSPYGWRIHPIYGYRKLHAGTDFRAYCGTPIIAAASGTVQWAKTVGGFGNQVMLNHGYPNGASLLTSYNHLSRFAVSAGQTVERGQVIGYSGTTGTSTACHLHLEAYVDGRTVDPETLM